MPDNADISDLNPAFTARLNPFLDALDKAGIQANVVSGYRSPELQSKLYANYQARQQGNALPYPQEGHGGIAAQPWSSFHNYGLAADVQPKNAADYPRMWNMAEQYGLTPLRQKDMDHFQMPGALADDINQYKLAGWRPASQPAPAQGAIAYAGPGQTVMPDSTGAARGPSYTFNLPANAPMGMGNNNPLNIKYVEGASYPGLVGPSKNTDQGDPQMVFSSPEAGWNAAYSLLSRKYGSGMTTPNQIIAGKGGWTPGNTQAAANVAKSAGIGADDDIGFSDPAKAAKFMRALVTQEQGGAGSAYPDAMIMAAVTGKPAPLGTTINSVPGGALAGGVLPGFGSQEASDQFKQGLSELDKGLGGQGLPGQSGGQPAQAQPSPIMQGAPGPRNVSPLLSQSPQLLQAVTGYSPRSYGQMINSMSAPLQWGAGPIGSPMYAHAGMQAPQGAPYGTSLAGLQNDPATMQMLMQYGYS